MTDKNNRALDLRKISRNTVAERDFWINQLVLEVKRLRELVASEREKK